MAVSAAAGVLAGRLIDAYGLRPVITIGSVLGVASVGAIAAAPNLLTFLRGVDVAGLAQAAVLYPAPTGTSTASSWSWE